MPLEPSVPPVNIYEGNGQLSVAVPIPGAHREHVEVTVGATLLTLRAECKYAQEHQHYHRRDWQVGSWETEIPLPQRVDPTSARATLHHGVLVVMAPLSDAGTGERTLTVE
jgi:HSP20 family molecular chaperone IbpA